jgi:PAS domain S-box-containing protein
MQEGLREIEEKYKFIVNAYGEMMTLINREYVYELVNDSWCRTFSKSKEDFIGKTVAEVWGEKKFETEIKEKLDQCLRGNVFKEEDSFIIAGGERRFYGVTYFPFRNKQKEVTHAVGVTNDITERKKAEIALKKSETELRDLNEKKDRYLNIINSDLEKASRYVNSLLPEEIDSQTLKIKWKIIPSSHLGGDSFGYHWIDDENLALYMLDVTGHGVGAALHSVSALNMLKFETLINTDFRNPSEVLNGLNQVFQMTDHYSLFITLWYIVYNKATRELTAAGAGHPPLIIYPSNGKPFKIASQNTMIGIDDQVTFRSDNYRIKENTDIFIYTDGSYEVRLPDDNMMKIDDLVDYLSLNRDKPDNEIESLYNHLVDLNSGNSLEDDFTMMKVSFVF